MKTPTKTSALAVAIGVLGCASARAQSSVTLTGLADLYFGQVKTAGNSKTVVDSGGMSTSYFGVRGSEDLGAGLKAVFALEAFFRADTGAAGRYDGDVFFARDAYVGLDSSFGRATLGRNTTPYFLSTVIFNPLGDSFVFSPMVANTFLGPLQTQVQADTGFKNSVRYMTPSFNGLYGDFVYSAGDERDTSPKGTNRAYELSAFYFGDMLSGAAVYRDTNLDSGSTVSSQKAFQVGATCNLGVAKLYGQYQNTKLDATGAPDFKGNSYQLGVTVPLGPGAVLASYVRSTYEGNTASTGDRRNSWALGYDYNLSRRTDLYAMYFDDRIEHPGSKNSTVGLGMRQRF